MIRRCTYIVVLGPDGCGKSTVADSIAERLTEIAEVVRCDFSFGILPSISRILNRKRKSPRPAEGTFMSGMVTPLSPVKATLVGIWYGIDHVLGHIVLFTARRRVCALVFARSYHDFLYQRAYDRIPRIIPRFFLAVGPRPNVIACPYRDPDVIHAVKPELTAKEIHDQYVRITSRLENLRGYHLVDATCGINDTVETVLSLALNSCVHKV